MIKESFQKKVAKLLEVQAIDVVKNSVGKSLPYSVHEVEIPAELKKADLENLSL